MKNLIYIIFLFSFFGYAMADSNKAFTAHDFAFKSIDGQHTPLSNFAGKSLLVVNTASRCGFTRQYAELQELWSNFKDDGLVVIGIPSNDFGGQEPYSEDKIKEFCKVNFDIDFPMMEKVKVSGDNAHPFYRWALTEGGVLAKPRWNFHKYLFDKKGNLIDWFSSIKLTHRDTEYVIRRSGIG